MLSKESRKEVARKFKEQKSGNGIYAVRSTVTGRVWVGMSRNLEATRNGCWFCLRNGMHQGKSLQQEWNAYGESAFQYEILDRLDDDVQPLVVHDQLKLKRGAWVAQLGAQQLL